MRMPCAAVPRGDGPVARRDVVSRWVWVLSRAGVGVSLSRGWGEPPGVTEPVRSGGRTRPGFLTKGPGSSRSRDEGSGCAFLGVLKGVRRPQRRSRSLTFVLTREPTSGSGADSDPQIPSRTPAHQGTGAGVVRSSPCPPPQSARGSCWAVGSRGWEGDGRGSSGRAIGDGGGVWVCG